MMALAGYSEHHLIGTETMPLSTAVQNSMAMGSMSVMASAAPPSVAAPMIA